MNSHLKLNFEIHLNADSNLKFSLDVNSNLNFINLSYEFAFVYLPRYLAYVGVGWGQGEEIPPPLTV